MEEKTVQEIYSERRAALYGSISQNIHDLTQMMKIVNNNFETILENAETINQFSNAWLEFHDKVSPIDPTQAPSEARSQTQDETNLP